MILKPIALACIITTNTLAVVRHKWIANTVGVAENPRGTAEMGVTCHIQQMSLFRGIHVINHGLYGGTGEPPLAEFYNNIFRRYL